ncbi:NADH dehydrogenase [ubiquinone] 1 alpha subcomplex subunit 8 [Xylocopa sonorina]|uniref:NADH dehydrogenase [ubiquinone] 1 alpha subcomplex subunit 8 n=1 Tax=Xylocopa sonorina TaxID=1818115 RepID=UPI00403B1AF5
MVVAKDFELPSDEELNVQEINIGWAYIHAAAVFLGKKCEWYNNEFMLCRHELKDPRKCLKEGRDVTKCALEGFQDIKKHCRDVFEAHVDCVVNTSPTVTNDNLCRKTRELFDDCMLKKLNLERPPFGYFCQAKVHDSPRPKPLEEVHEYPDPIPDPSPPPFKPAKYGGRTGFSR